MNMHARSRIHKAGESGAIKSKLIAWLAILFALLVLAIGVRWAVQKKYERARANWKTATLTKLAGLSVTNQDIRQELQNLGGVGEHREWIGDHVLLMTNGECLMYAFRHGFNNGFVDHLFLAHASDGRWFYSTYHFCNSMAGIIADKPPGSISEFASRYSAREFDGKSDVCLQHTWPLKE